MKYAVTVGDVFPAGLWSPDAPPDRGLLGVSVGNPNFRGRRLRALLDWVADHTTSCVLAIGDELYGISAKLKGLGSAKAEEIAHEAATRQVEEIADALESVNKGSFRIVRWSELHREAAPFRNEIQVAFRLDPAFRGSVESTAREYLVKRSLPEDVVRLQLCCDYVLEELAGFAALLKPGIRLEFYPGRDLPVLQEATMGRYGLSPLLRSRIYVELQVSDRKGRIHV